MMRAFTIKTIVRFFQGNWRPWTALLVCGLPLFGGGCSSTKPAEKPAHVRGWIGGEYDMVRSFSKSLSPRPKAGLLITALSTNTPIYAAGLRQGDVILQFDHQPVKYLRDFRLQVDACEPGAVVPISALRNNQTMACDLTVGRETFRYNGIVAIGLPGYSDGWSLWPRRGHPELSLLVLGYESSLEERSELGSVKNSYLFKLNPKHEVHDEDWRFWLAIMQLSKNETILKQELAVK